MNGNGEQLVPQPVSKRWKGHWRGDSLQSAPRAYAALPPDYERGTDVQNTNDQTGSEDCTKRFGFFHVIVAELTRESRKSGSRNNRSDNGTVDANL